MKTPLLAALSLATAASLAGAVAELNPIEGTIDTPDGSFSARDFTIADGFKLELMYIVPPESGSWFPMTWDDQGRLIVSSHNTERMFRIKVPAVGTPGEVELESINLPIGSAHGLLYAFDTLYVTVNNGQNNRSGVYRVTDTNGDDQYDQIRVIRNISGGGQHGQHTLKLAPDGQHISLISGDDVPATPTTVQKMRPIWGEDDLIRTVANSFNNYQLAPQAWIALFDPVNDPLGETSWTLFAMGMRNPVDHSWNKDGEMFTYDADHELDMGDPWYRPTSVYHVTSGSDFGFRLRGSKHPFYYVDFRKPIAIVGAGSPTGNTFGTNTKFPARYQDSFFINDSSYGNVWAVQVTPDGSSYKAQVTPFVSGRPFGVYGSIVNPADGTLLLTSGSQLYRVSYAGPESTAPTQPDTIYADRRAVRKSLEAFHGGPNPAAVNAVWPYLGDHDESIRYAARIALEWQDPAQWQDRALALREPRALTSAMVALARVSGLDEFHRPPDYPPPNQQLKARMLSALDGIDWKSLPVQEKLEVLRAYSLVFIRMGRPTEEVRNRLIAKFDPYLPAPHRELNWELAELLTYLEADSAATKVMALLRDAPSPAYYGTPEYANPLLRTRQPGVTGGLTNQYLAMQEDQIQYAEILRGLQAGWTPELRREYLEWFQTAYRDYRGGSSFLLSIRTIRTDAIAMIPEADRAAVQDLIDTPLAAQ